MRDDSYLDGFVTISDDDINREKPNTGVHGYETCSLHDLVWDDFCGDDDEEGYDEAEVSFVNTDRLKLENFDDTRDGFLCRKCLDDGYCGNCLLKSDRFFEDVDLRVRFDDCQQGRIVRICEKDEEGYLVRRKGMSTKSGMINYFMGMSYVFGKYMYQSHSKMHLTCYYELKTKNNGYDNAFLCNLLSSHTDNNPILSTMPNCVCSYTLDKVKHIIRYTFTLYSDENTDTDESESEEDTKIIMLNDSVEVHKLVDNEEDEVEEVLEQDRITYVMDYKDTMNQIKRSLLKANVPKDSQVLDLGIGKGQDIYKYRSLGIGKLFGYDVDKESLKECKKRYDKMIHNQIFPLQLIHGRFQDHASMTFLEKRFWGNTAFDAVVSFFSLQHMCNTEAAFRRNTQMLYNTMCPGGSFCCIYPNPDAILKYLRNSTHYSSVGKLFSLERGAPLDPFKFGSKYKFKSKFIEVEENLVPWGLVKDIMNKSGLRLVYYSGCGDYYRKIRHSKKVASYDRKAQEVWDLVCLYTICVFKRPGDLPNRIASRPMPDPAVIIESKVAKVKKKANKNPGSKHDNT